MAKTARKISMGVTDELKRMGVVPVDYAALTSVLGRYKSPKDKVSRMEASGDLIRLKKGLYIVSSKNTDGLYSQELIANHLYGPSYVSFETALSYYGLIPERAYLIKSMTTKRAKKFTTPVGDFAYTKANTDYFGVGIGQILVDDKYAFLIATPEKALCDLICCTPGLRIQSKKAMLIYLDQDIRVDLSETRHWDLRIIDQAIQSGKKKRELRLLLEVLNDQ
jgi:predicted transcriptional regulator of viral defense system